MTIVLYLSTTYAELFILFYFILFYFQIAVQCGIFHGDEILCKPIHTSEKMVEEKDDKCVWNETLHFEIKVCNLPRAAKLCLCIYEFSITQKNGRFRKYAVGSKNIFLNNLFSFMLICFVINVQKHFTI